MSDAKTAVTQSMQRQGNNGQGSNGTSIKALIQRQTPGFKMALPKDFDADRFTRLALTALNNNPKLAECTPASVLASLMLAAQAGLEPNSVLHESSIIPYKNNKTNRMEAQFQIEYRGLLKLVWNSGMVLMVDYGMVYPSDQFTFKKGFPLVLEHEEAENRGPNEKPTKYYAIAELHGGGRVAVVKSVDDIKKHAARFSRAYGSQYKSSPWQTDFDMMAIKTCLKELCDKKLPKRTTNEAIKFHSLVARDETVSRLTPEQLLAMEAGQAVNIGEIEAEEVNYTNDDNEENTQEDPSQYNNPDFFIKQLEQAKTKKDCDAIMNTQDVKMFVGEDKEKIDKAYLQRVEELKKK